MHCRRGEFTQIKAHAATVRRVDFSWDGGHLLTCSDDKSVKLWALPSRRFQCSLLGHSNWVRAATFSPDARVVASGGDDKTVRLWDVETHTCLHTLTDHTECVSNPSRAAAPHQQGERGERRL